jgi:multiple sugar transport system ATP-binding protein
VLEGTVEQDGDAPVVRLGASTLALPRDAADSVGAYGGKRIAVGIRPEALGENGRGEGRLRGMVRAVEALGPEQLAHVEVEAPPVLVEDVVEGLVDAEEAQDLADLQQDGARATVVARLDASSSVRQDEPIDLSVDLRKLHFFDLDTGAAIRA